MLERIKALTEKIRSNIEHRHDLADTLDQLGNKVAALEGTVEALVSALEVKFGAAPAEGAAPVQVETTATQQAA
ncbi:hypothetical protein [Burkholderia cepacia]|uniref:hypothetical protein n=1 Tax=Burkholderia cepacia TaxID=292 RepID=UPI001CF465DC|nr:hypothetical protein [Burkholderia cepacia]MCA8115684.1 hypothetical protein [Burkholderia cepacia]MCA8402771.1 hypothetical protein [Burkholderia cepacia]